MRASFPHRVFKLAFIAFFLLSSYSHGFAAGIESDSYLRYMPERGVSSAQGDVSITVAESKCSYETEAFGKLPLNFALSTQYIGINSTSAVKLPGKLTGVSLDSEATFPFFTFKDTYLRLGVSPSFYADNWDFPTSAFRIPVYTYLAYKPNQKWVFIAGVAVFPDFRDQVFPILGFIYKPSDRLEFNITPERPNISYTLNKRLKLFLEGDLNIDNEFEVEHNGSKGVVLRYGEDRLGAGLKFSPASNIEASFSAGTCFNRDFEYLDSSGKVDIKSGPYLELRVVAQF